LSFTVPSRAYGPRIKLIDSRHFRKCEKDGNFRTAQDCAVYGKEEAMSKSMWIASALAAAVALPAVAVNAAPVAPQPKSEKCFGVAKAGQNDCQTATSSCAATSKADRQPDAWIYLPKGLCQKLAGGSLKAPQLKAQ
jgi:uncharacterized membrane protein